MDANPGLRELFSIEHSRFDAAILADGNNSLLKSPIRYSPLIHFSVKLGCGNRIHDSFFQPVSLFQSTENDLIQANYWPYSMTN